MDDLHKAEIEFNETYDAILNKLNEAIQQNKKLKKENHKLKRQNKYLKNIISKFKKDEKAERQHYRNGRRGSMFNG